jgi:hypothetical protein
MILGKVARITMILRTSAPDGAVANLTEPECVERLLTGDVGRIAWRAADGLQILPICYRWHLGTIVFRTSPYGVLSEFVRSNDVVFETDAVDPPSGQWWSVVVRGRAEVAAEPEGLKHSWPLDDPVRWTTGVRNLFVRITPGLITGRSSRWPGGGT